MKRKIISVIMLIVMLASSFSFSALAASSRYVSVPASHSSWSADVTCTLTKKKKNAKVRVTMDNWGVNLDVRMRNGSKVIWSQNNAIQYSKKAVAYVYRDFDLGCDHTYYSLSFRCNKNAGCAPGVTVKSLKYCTVS